MSERKKLGIYQKILLVLMIILTLVYAVFYFIMCTKDWYSYRDNYLLYSEDDGKVKISGEIEGENVVITANVHLVEDGYFAKMQLNEIEVRYGEEEFGPYVIKNDDSAVIENPYSINLTGITVYCGEELRFRGGIREYDGRWLLYNEDGTGGAHEIKNVADDGTTIGALGNIVGSNEPDIGEILELWEGPETVQLVSGEVLVWGLIICIFNAVSMIYADNWFKWNIRFYVKDAYVYDAEPSTWVVVSRYILWTLLFILAVVIYLVGILVPLQALS